MNEASTRSLSLSSSKRTRWKTKTSLINTTNSRFDLIRNTAAKFGIHESTNNWDIIWTDVSTSVERCRAMKRYQRINHFPGMMEICQKHYLARNLNRLLKAFPQEYKIFPRTWCLRSDLHKVVEYAKAHREECFIIKPDFGCQGKGIIITRNISQLREYDEMICQIYIQKPFLIDGYKFDLRIYVLITSCDPLRVFVYNEGLARFATSKYEKPNSRNYSNMYMHLTNYSVNKHSSMYVVDGNCGSKRKLSTINEWFQRSNYDTKKIWESVDDVIIKTILISLPTIRHYYRTAFPNHRCPHACFEILGFDFLFDHRLKPYLLEVNHSPSFYTETAIDCEVKESLLYDAFVILNLQNTDRIKVQNHNLATQARIEWEDKHLGNFRKIYPGIKVGYYEKFIGATQNTIFTGTISSIAKERQKEPILERKMRIGPGSTRSGSFRSGSRRTKPKKPKTLLQRVLSDVIMTTAQPRKKERLAENVERSLDDLDCYMQSITLSVDSDSNHIDEYEEKERIQSRKEREFLIKDHGVFEKVFENLKRAGLLRPEDEAKIKRDNMADNEESDESEATGYLGFSKSVAKFLEAVSTKTGGILSTKAKNFMQMLSLRSEKEADSPMMNEDPMEGFQSGLRNKDASKPARLNFEPCFIDTDEENERVLAMEERETLMVDANVLERVYDNLKKAGVLKLEDQIKAVLSKRWSGRGSNTGITCDKSHSMDDRVVKVLDCLWNKSVPKMEAEFRPKLALPTLDTTKLTRSRLMNPPVQVDSPSMSKSITIVSMNEPLSYSSVTSTPSEQTTTLFTVLETMSMSTEVWGTPEEQSEQKKIHNGCWRNP